MFHRFPSSRRRAARVSITCAVTFVSAAAGAAALGGCPGADPQTAGNAGGGGGEIASGTGAGGTTAPPDGGGAGVGGGDVDGGNDPCPGTNRKRCKGQCVDLTTAQNCGECGRSCSVPNSTDATCEALACKVTCIPGFVNVAPVDALPICLPTRKVFVTDAPVENFPSTGVGGPDHACSSLATQANITIPGSWGAWLSTTGLAAIDKIVGPAFKGAYLLVDGSKIVTTVPELRAGKPLRNPIDISEMGKPPSQANGNLVWTGSDPMGTATLQDCSSWLSTNGMATVGMWSSSDAAWTQATTAACNMPRRLYCFETE